MSDDYDDEDEPGGLWDPDAFTPPPAPARPALHVVPRPTSPSGTPQRRARRFRRDTLVRLEQFRPTAEGDADSHERHRRISARHGLQVAAALVATALSGTGALRLTAESRPRDKTALRPHSSGRMPSKLR